MKIKNFLKIFVTFMVKILPKLQANPLKIFDFFFFCDLNLMYLMG